MLKRVFSIIGIIVSSWVLSQAQGVFLVSQEPVCWTIEGVDSSLTQTTFISNSTASAQVLFFTNAAGDTVTVSGGILNFGICACCVAATLSLPDVTIESLSQPVQNPFDPLVCRSGLIASTNGVTSADQITVELDGSPVSFNFNSMTGEITATLESVTGTGIHTVEVTVVTPDGTDTESDTFNC